jgi:transposase-like protein
MSTEHAYGSDRLQPLLRAPECPRCTMTMRLICIVPHDRYRNLDERRFRCEVCPETFSDTAARLDL